MESSSSATLRASSTPVPSPTALGKAECVCAWGGTKTFTVSCNYNISHFDSYKYKGSEGVHAWCYPPELERSSLS